MACSFNFPKQIQLNLMLLSFDGSSISEGSDVPF